MEIRPATPQDVPGIAASLHAVAQERRFVGTEPSRTLAELEERFRAALERGEVLLVLADGSKIAGAAGLHDTAARGVQSLGIHLIEAARGAGWGRRLLRAATAAGFAGGARKLELEVWVDNARAIALYESEGWVVEGLRRDHWQRLDGEIRSTLLMARFPDPAS